MVRIKVEYDKHSRSFKLIDPEVGTLLDHRAEYEVLVPFLMDGMPEEDNLILVSSIPLAHA